MAKFKVGDIFQLINGSPMQWKVNSIANKQYYYEQHPNTTIRMGSVDISFIDDFYELVPPKFKFPIGSKISWNVNPKEIYLVNGFDYEKDQYILETTQDAMWSHKKGFKFPYTRILTEEEHTLIPNEEPKMEWKFKIGDKICVIGAGRPQCEVVNYTVDGKYVYKSLMSTTAPGQIFIDTGVAFEAVIPEQPKCIPPNPQVSGWHWIKSEGGTDTQSPSQPRWWSSRHQAWSGTHCTKMAKSIDPAKAYDAQWRYDKPCNY